MENALPLGFSPGMIITILCKSKDLKLGRSGGTNVTLFHSTPKAGGKCLLIAELNLFP